MTPILSLALHDLCHYRQSARPFYPSSPNLNLTRHLRTLETILGTKSGSKNVQAQVLMRIYLSWEIINRHTEHKRQEHPFFKHKIL
jgi:hypothetical protein